MSIYTCEECEEHQATTEWQSWDEDGDGYITFLCEVCAVSFKQADDLNEWSVVRYLKQGAATWQTI